MKSENSKKFQKLNLITLQNISGGRYDWLYNTVKAVSDYFHLADGNYNPGYGNTFLPGF